MPNKIIINHEMNKILKKHQPISHTPFTSFKKEWHSMNIVDNQAILQYHRLLLPHEIFRISSTEHTSIPANLKGNHSNPWFPPSLTNP